MCGPLKIMGVGLAGISVIFIEGSRLSNSWNKIKDREMSNLRETIMAEEDLIASKRRFGLFSQPPPLAVGDDA